jgi:WD40 repeat protein
MSTATAISVEPVVSESTKEGPYVGLRTYEEKDAGRYFGREEIVAELARMVRRSSLTVLFGVSGTGKSSMLRAGLFPIVRNELHLPILIRLDFTEKVVKGEMHPPMDLRAQVRARIVEELDEWNVDAKRPEAGQSLRDYFAQHPWWNPRNKPLTPFLVFDQFEEIFTIGRDYAEQVASLMDELAELVERPAVQAESQVDVIAPRPRLMFTLREDFLAHLEDYRVRMPSLAANRYRLTRMNGTQALHAVLDPARDIVDELTAKKIVRFVAGGAASTDAVDASEDEEEKRHPLDTLEVEPAILSLVCEQLDIRRRKANEPAITVSLLKAQGEQIVEGFYDAAFADLPKKVRVLVEDRLVTNEGFRTTMAKDAAYDNPGVTEDSIEALLRKKILREEVRFGSLHIELIHDRLATIARDSRAHRREEEREKLAREREKAREQERAARWRKRLWIIGGALLALIAAGVITFVVIARAKKNQEAKDRARGISMQLAAFLLRASSDALARNDMVSVITQLGDAEDALKGTGQKAPPEASVLRTRALLALARSTKPVDHGSEIDAVRLTSNGMVTAGRDGSLRTWVGGQLQGTIPGDPSGAAIEGTYPGHAGKWVLVLRNDGSGVVWDLDEKQPRISFQGSAIETAQKATAQVAAPRVAPPGLSPPTAVRAAPAAAPPVARTQPTQKQSNIPRGVWRACVAPDDSIVAVWNTSRRGIRVWQTNPDQLLDSMWLELTLAHDVLCLAKGKLAVLTITGDVVFGDTKSQKESTHYVPDAGNTGVFAAADDGSVIAVELIDGVQLFFAQRDRKSATVSVPATGRVELSPDGNHLLVAGDQEARTFIGVWSTGDFTLEYALERPAADARFVGTGSDLALIVTSNHSVEAWSVRTWLSLGTSTLDVDLADARVDVRSSAGSITLAAARNNTATIRSVATIDWDDGAVLDLAEQLGAWHVEAAWNDEQLKQRSVDRLRVDIAGKELVLRQPQVELDREPFETELADTRIALSTEAPPIVRVAALRADGVVSILSVTDDKLTPVAARLETSPVRAIRWSARQQLITLGWTQTQIWSRDGKLLETIPGAADDARLVYSPHRIVWTCVRAECSAWDPTSKQRLSRQQFEGATRLELHPTDPVAVARQALSTDAVLLPIIARDPHDFAVPGPIRELSWLGNSLVAASNDGDAYLVAANRRIAAGPVAASARNDVFAARGASLLTGPLESHVAGTAATSWHADAPIIALRVRGNTIGVVDARLQLALLDAGHLAPDPRNKPTPTDEVQAAGASATLSPNGDRYAVVTPSSVIEVRSKSNGSLIGTYTLLAGQQVRRVMVPNTGNSLAALTDDGLAVWTQSGPPRTGRRSSYRDAYLGADGRNLAALRIDNVAELMTIEGNDLNVQKVIPAERIAMDDNGTRVAVATAKGKVEMFQFPDLGKPINTWRPEPKLLAPTVAPVLSTPAAKYMWLPAQHRLVSVANDGFKLELKTATHCVFGSGDTVACVFAERTGLVVEAVDLETGKRSGIQMALPRAPEKVVRCTTTVRGVAFAAVNGRTGTIYALPEKGATTIRASEGLANVAACSLDDQLLWTLTDKGLVRADVIVNSEIAEQRGGASLLAAHLSADDVLRAAIAAPGHDVMIASLSQKGRSVQYVSDSAAADRAVFVSDNEIAIAAGRKMSIATLAAPARTRSLDTKSDRAVTALVMAGQLLVAGHEDGIVEMWKPGEQKAFVVLPGHGSPARFVALDHASRWAAVSYDDGSVQIWQMAHDPKHGGRVPLVRLDARGRTRGAAAILFGNDDPATTLYTGNADGQVKRWNIGAPIPDAAAITQRVRDEAKVGAH